MDDLAARGGNVGECKFGSRSTCANIWRGDYGDHCSEVLRLIDRWLITATVESRIEFDC